MLEHAPVADANPLVVENKNALLAFRPGLDGPWNRQTAAHLARRSGFAMKQQTVNQYVELGPRSAVDSLFEINRE